MSKKSIQLSNGETIAYQLERRARRTVGLKITADGLVVHAPKYILEFQLKKLIQEKSNWILSKLDARKKNHIPPIIWQSGETMQLLGNAINLNVVQDTKNKQAQFKIDEKLSKFVIKDNTKIISAEDMRRLSI